MAKEYTPKQKALLKRAGVKAEKAPKKDKSKKDKIENKAKK